MLLCLSEHMVQRGREQTRTVQFTKQMENVFGAPYLSFTNYHNLSAHSFMF